VLVKKILNSMCTVHVCSETTSSSACRRASTAADAVTSGLKAPQASAFCIAASSFCMSLTCCSVRVHSINEGGKSGQSVNDNDEHKWLTKM
jgi:hypothetical protein